MLQINRSYMKVQLYERKHVRTSGLNSYIDAILRWMGNTITTEGYARTAISEYVNMIKRTSWCDCWYRHNKIPQLRRGTQTNNKGLGNNQGTSLQQGLGTIYKHKCYFKFNIKTWHLWSSVGALIQLQRSIKLETQAQLVVNNYMKSEPITGTCYLQVELDSWGTKGEQG